MSFVNLLGSDVWSEADIVNRTEAELHSIVSKRAELILSRKMIGFSLGRLIPSAQEASALTEYEIAAYMAQQSGLAARADMALLQSALDYEAAQARLQASAIIEPPTITSVDLEGIETVIANPGIAIDAAERVAAQALIDGAAAETIALVLLRNPPPEPEPVPEVLP